MHLHPAARQVYNAPVRLRVTAGHSTTQTEPHTKAVMRYRFFTLRLRRPAAWSKWLALIAVVCTVSLYSIEATHYHHTLAEQLHCPAGHAVGHSPANLFVPDCSPDVAALGERERKGLPLRSAPVSNPLYFLPQSHAPPAIAG